MVSEQQSEVDALVADYRRSREQLAEVQRALTAISETARSQDGTVTATVGRGGVLSALEITPDAYRAHTPERLGALIVRTTAAAAAQAAARAGEVLRPALPDGMEPAAVLSGTGELRPGELGAFDEPAPRVTARATVRRRPVVEDDDEEDMEDRNWLGRPW